jgi:prepilin peptidase CpaA
VTGVLFGAVFVILAAAALQDLASLRISNLFPLLIVLIFIGWVVARGWEVSLWMNLVSFVAVLALGTGLFSLGWLGGGDVKLLAALALWFDWHGLVWLVAFTFIAGFFLVFVLYGFRRMVPKDVRQRSSLPIFAKKGPIPYGVAIALGASLALFSPGPHPARPRHLDRAIPTDLKTLLPQASSGIGVDDQLRARAHLQLFEDAVHVNLDGALA